MKIRVGVTFDIRKAGEPPDHDELAAHLAEVMDALMDLDVIDPDLSSTLSTGHVEMSVIVDATDELDAIEKGIAALRTGIRSIDGPVGWSLAEGHTSVTTEKLEFTSA